jgi:hypothetical protein
MTYHLPDDRPALTLGPIEELAHILQSMLDRMDGDPSRSWEELSRPEKDFYGMCIYRILSEGELIRSARKFMEETQPPRSTGTFRSTLNGHFRLHRVRSRLTIGSVGNNITHVGAAYPRGS